MADGGILPISLSTLRKKAVEDYPQSKTLRVHPSRWEVRQVLDCASPLSPLAL